MTTTFLLIRHAATEDLDVRLSGRRAGVALSDAGEMEAAALAAMLARAPIDQIVASPLERTRSTADAIGRAADRPVTLDNALLELDVGEWTGARFDALEPDPRWRRWNTERATACSPGGETMAAAQARIVGLIRRLANDCDGKTVALVTHSDLIRAAVCDVLGLGLDAMHRFAIDPASVTTVAMGSWGARLVRLNEKAL